MNSLSELLLHYIVSNAHHFNGLVNQNHCYHSHIHWFDRLLVTWFATQTSQCRARWHHCILHHHLHDLRFCGELCLWLGSNCAWVKDLWAGWWLAGWVSSCFSRVFPKGLMVNGYCWGVNQLMIETNSCLALSNEVKVVDVWFMVCCWLIHALLMVTLRDVVVIQLSGLWFPKGMKIVAPIKNHLLTPSLTTISHYKH